MITKEYNTPYKNIISALFGPMLALVEGLILGVAAKMFVFAGSAIVYSTVASVVYGIIYWITTLI